ncbi:MAG: fumarate hydratase [Elusimicrobia bacterium]|nr:fumarate hydratase [Elusimicrobiota bacterium]
MDAALIERTITDEAVRATYMLPSGLRRAIADAAGKSSGLEKKVLDSIVRNISIGQKCRIPVCQDTGVFEVWVKIGLRKRVPCINFSAIVRRAVRKAHAEGKLRASMKKSIEPVVHISFNDTCFIEIIITPRGFGSENYSSLHMMNPESGFEDVKRTVIEAVARAGGHPCPPYLVGVGIGGTASKAIEMSGEALTRMDFRHSAKEKELLAGINSLKTGAGGMGGRFTALGVRIVEFPQHIAGLAVGVRIGCWCNRVRRFRIEIP